MTEKIGMVFFFKLEIKGKSNTQCLFSAKSNTFYRKSAWYSFMIFVYLPIYPLSIYLAYRLIGTLAFGYSFSLYYHHFTIELPLLKQVACIGLFLH